MKTYHVVNVDTGGRLNVWAIAPFAMRVYEMQTGDRRVARRAVRMARKMGYAGVRFTTRPVDTFPARD